MMKQLTIGRVSRHCRTLRLAHLEVEFYIRMKSHGMRLRMDESRIIMGLRRSTWT